MWTGPARSHLVRFNAAARASSIAVIAGVMSISLLTPAQAQEAASPEDATAAAAQEYLRIICPANAALANFGKTLARAEKAGMREGSPMPKYLVKALNRDARASAKAAQQLTDYQWPTADLTWVTRNLAEGYYRDAGEMMFIAQGETWRYPRWAATDGFAFNARFSLGLPGAGKGCPAQ